MPTNIVKYKSQVCFNGKRIAAMREIAKAAFEESFLTIEVGEREFIIRIDDKKAHKKEKFETEHRQCRIIVYKELLFSQL